MECKIEIFCCYAREDKALLGRLRRHLTAMERQDLITIWSDIDIDAGDVWEEEINKHLDTAHIILLLISADFMASNYCYSKEMTRALERHEAKEALVLPIILRACDWRGPPFARLQALPTDAQPVTDRNYWRDKDTPFEDITRRIRVVVDELRLKHMLCEAQKLYDDHHNTPALALYEQATQLDQKSAKAYRGKGNALYNLKRYRESLEAYVKARQADSSILNADCYSRQADAYVQLAHYEESLAAYDEAIRLNPVKAMKVDLYQSKASVLHKLKRYDEALACYDAALLVDTENARVYVEKANTFLSMGKNEEAKASYSEALKLQPCDAQFHLHLKSLLAKIDTGAYASAQQTYLPEPEPPAIVLPFPTLRRSPVQQFARIPLRPTSPPLSEQLQLGKDRKTQRQWLRGGVVVLIIGLLMAIVPILSRLTSTPTPAPALHVVQQLTSTPTLGLGVVQQPHDEYIGVNDGQYHPFDVGSQRANSNLKIQAAQKLHDGNSQAAIALWNQCLTGQDTNDAEVKIYIENQRTVAFDHVTLIVGLDFLQPSQEMTAQSVLQGAYLAQKEFNTQHKNIKLRLLLANTGGELSYIPAVVQQIASIARHDQTVVGVLGWQTSSRTQNVLMALQKANITLPMLSESAAADNLTNISPHFFRIVPPNKIQTQAAVLVASKFLHAAHAIVFMDPDDLYSQSFGQDFKQQFPDSQEEDFTVEKTTSTTFSAKLKQVLKNHEPSNTVILFAATFQYDTNQFQIALGNYPGWQVITGASGTAANPSIYGRWYAISSSFHDEWSALMGNNAPFFQQYPNEFDPDKKHPGYYYENPDANAIVSYDATNVLAHGIDRALLNGANSLTPPALENELQQIKGSQAWQGSSGLISFGTDHDPIDKALIVLMVNNTGHFHMGCVQGTFATNTSNAVPQCAT